ncbi:hypothetical protein I3843_10G057800 [Carya illinoinensis]|nr:hypothetical protein I3843_10G057800 [Carya illinoinensis]
MYIYVHTPHAVTAKNNMNKKMLHNPSQYRKIQGNQKTGAAAAMMINRYHNPVLSANQCGSFQVQTIDAPLPLVWSVVRRFENPKAYKQFVRSSTMRAGNNGGIGSIRDVNIVSGLPARTSTERLEKLDDDMHIMIFSIIGGDHRLVNYRSTTTLHEEAEEKTVVIESYVVDVPLGSSKEDTCTFADTIIGCNLKCLARMTEKMARGNLDF